MQFRQTQSLSPGEREVLMAQGSDLPGTDSLDLVWRPKELQLTLYDGDQPLSTCGLLHLTIPVAGRHWQVGGIGGVVTAPAQRRRGYGRAVVAEALRILDEEWQQQAVILFCRSQLVRFYHRFGFQLIEAPVSILQPAGAVLSPVPVMVLEFGDHVWPPGDVVIDGLPW